MVVVPLSSAQAVQCGDLGHSRQGINPTCVYQTDYCIGQIVTLNAGGVSSLGHVCQIWDFHFNVPCRHGNNYCGFRKTSFAICLTI